MRALDARGERAAALAQYAACRDILERELGVEPGPETEALAERIRERRAPRRAVASVPHNLPAAVSPFVGREGISAEIVAHLCDPDCRLLSLVGPGGSGKTLLALKVARSFVDREADPSFADGVYFVPLAGLQASAEMSTAIGSALGLSFHQEGSPWQQLYDYVRERRKLIVLDNLEHLLAPVASTPAPAATETQRGGAPAGPSFDEAEAREDAPGAADLVTGMLQAAPGLKIVVTSRTRVRVRGEQIVPVGGLRYPEALPADLSVLEDYSAVELYLLTARHLQRDFQPTGEDLAHVVHICQLVEGMPLALRLAAAWSEMLTPAEIAGELDQAQRALDFLAADWRDAPARQRSMRAVFDYTWRLLGEREQALLAAISVFRGGFTQDAARAVAGASLRDLVTLVNRSLLNRTREGRYEIHELLRQYAAERLEVDPERAERARDAHCAFYASYLASRGDAIDRFGVQREVLLEMDNVRAAWRWAVQRDRSVDILKLAHVLHLVLTNRGWLQEGEASFEWAAGVLRRGETTGERAVALAFALIYQGRFRRQYYGQMGRQLGQEGLALLRAHADRRALAWGTIQAYFAGGFEGYADCAGPFQESLAYYREIGDLSRVTDVLNALANAAITNGLYREAEPYCQEVLQIATEIDHPRSRGWALQTLGRIAEAGARYVEARRYYEEARKLFRATGYGPYASELAVPLGDLSLATGDYAGARAQYQNVLDSHGGQSLPREVLAAIDGLGNVALARGNVREAAHHYRRLLQVAADRGDHIRLRALVAQARLLASRDKDRAVEVAGLVADHPHSEARIVARASDLLAALRAELDAERFAAARERGRARDLESTVRELLAEMGEE
jgi:predicted ATPase